MSDTNEWMTDEQIDLLIEHIKVSNECVTGTDRNAFFEYGKGDECIRTITQLRTDLAAMTKRAQVLEKLNQQRLDLIDQLTLAEQQRDELFERYGGVPADQLKDITLKDFVATRFVKVNEHNEACDRLTQQRDAAVEAAHSLINYCDISHEIPVGIREIVDNARDTLARIRELGERDVFCHCDKPSCDNDGICHNCGGDAP